MLMKGLIKTFVIVTHKVIFVEIDTILNLFNNRFWYSEGHGFDPGLKYA